METLYHSLKEDLQRFGALRPTTWEFLLSRLHAVNLQAGERFPRREGQIAYVRTGLLKEHDAYERRYPAIVNFLAERSFFMSNSVNIHHYLEAGVPTQVLYLQAEPLWLYQYKELASSWNALIQQYETGIFFRQYLLEIKDTTARIEAFKTQFRACLKYLLKKEMANYLNIGYHHFIRIYR